MFDIFVGLEKDFGVLDGVIELLGLGGLFYKVFFFLEVDYGFEGILVWDVGD